jgi:hypothetical protein
MFLDLLAFAFFAWLIVAVLLFLTGERPEQTKNSTVGTIGMCLAWPYILIVGLYQLSKHSGK